MTVWLQKYEHGLGKEEQVVYQHLIVEGIKARFFTAKEMFDDDFKLSECDLLVGSIECVTEALRLLGKSSPKPNYYPSELEHLFKRDIWKSTPLEVISLIAQESEVFAKPVKWKLFTGQVFSASSGYALINSIKESNPVEPLYLSSVVEWVSEHRVYVDNGNLVAVCQYSGVDDMEIPLDVVEKAIASLSKGEYPCSYTFDLGILQDGSVALVEMNDAFSIGAYKGIEPKDYYLMLKSRWNEMTD